MLVVGGQVGAGGTGTHGRGQVDAGLHSEAAGLLGTLLGQQCVATNAGRQETTGRRQRAALPSRSNVAEDTGDIPGLSGGVLGQLQKDSMLSRNSCISHVHC